MDMKFLLYFILPTVLGVVILLAGIIFMWIASRRKKKAGFIDIEDWGTTGGKVLSVRLEEHKKQTANKNGENTESIFEPVVEYVFTVNEVEYHGNKIFPGTSKKLGKDPAQEIIDEYPENSYVPVRYDPENPSESALMPSIQQTDYVQLAGWLFTGFGVSVCCFTILMSVIILGAVQ